ncbi:MAG: GreA/GreB family elongation factor [Lachnospiraceae bacterium]
MRDRLIKSDIDKMKEEIEYRKLVLRKELLEHVKVARAHGDLSENFEYHAAKKEKNKNESRIRYLDKMIRSAIIIEDTSKEDEVGINNEVMIYFEEDDDTETYKIVTTIRGDSLKQMISIESPLGKALMGKKIGDRACVKVNDDYSYYVKVINITKNIGDEEDRIRGY